MKSPTQSYTQDSSGFQLNKITSCFICTVLILAINKKLLLDQNAESWFGSQTFTETKVNKYL